MTSFISKDILNYLSRPITPQEQLWIYDDFVFERRVKYHNQMSEQYKNSDDINSQLKFAHHTQEAARWRARISPGPDMVLTSGPKTSLVKPNLNRPAFLLEPGKADLIKMNKCPSCKKEIDSDDFKTEIQKSEYGITGTCVECQSKMFPN